MGTKNIVTFDNKRFINIIAILFFIGHILILGLAAFGVYLAVVEEYPDQFITYWIYSIIIITGLYLSLSVTLKCSKCNKKLLYPSFVNKKIKSEKSKYFGFATRVLYGALLKKEFNCFSCEQKYKC